MLNHQAETTPQSLNTWEKQKSNYQCLTTQGRSSHQYLTTMGKSLQPSQLRPNKNQINLHWEKGIHDIKISIN